MHGGESLAHFTAMTRLRLAQPHAFQKRDQCGGTARKFTQKLAIVARQGQRTRQAVCEQMLLQAQKERQIRLFHPLFIERQDQRLFCRVQQKIGVFHALGNALIGCQLTDIILSEKLPQIVFADIRVNCQFSIS